MIKVRSNNHKLEIYEDSNRVTLRNTLVALGVFSIGIPFIYLGCLKNDWFFCGGGILASCLGGLIGYQTLKAYKKLKEHKGFIHVRATTKGLSIDSKKTIVIFNLYLLSWVQINKILLVKLLVSNIENDEGITRTTNKKDKEKEKILQSPT